MITDRTRTEVWYELRNSSRLVRYYEALADRYRRKETVFLIGFVFFAVLSFVSLQLTAMWGYTFLKILPFLPFFGTHVLLYWIYVSGIQKKVVILNQVSTGCCQLDDEWRELWSDVERGGTSEKVVVGRIRELSHRTLELTKLPGDMGIVTDKALNKQSAEEADAELMYRYAAQ